MAETNPPAAPRPRRWGKVLLFVSLAFNLLIIGAVAGALLGGPRDRDRRPALRDLGFGPYVQALPLTDRVALGLAMRREAGAFRENRDVLRRQFEAFLDALRVEPYDHAEVTRIITLGQNQVIERQRLGRVLLLERIAAMDAAERAAYAKALDDALRRRKPHQGPREE